MIKNKVLLDKMLEIIKTTVEASEYLYEIAKNKKYSNFIGIADDIQDAINSVYIQITNIKKSEDLDINLDLACENAIYSIERIKNLSKSRSKTILDKIEFELIPILEDMYLQLYFWGGIYPYKQRIHNYYKNELINLCHNKYIDNYAMNGRYKYDLSVVIVGYNKLEYTKACVESLLKYIPDNINYELILLNHGSSDGTKDYFEYIKPTKQVDILRNGGSPTVTQRIIQGKYCLTISNDILVTENAIVNMIKCIESDENIAWVVPSTSNVSNLQTIPIEYSSIDEMYERSRENNINDRYRWEQRVRLCNPIDLKKSNIWYSSNGIGWGGYFHTKNNISFPDDKVSMIFRRKGYKMILAKDAYCHHFGSVTLKEEIDGYIDKEKNIESELFYEKGRKEFFSVFGIDPWSIGHCFDFELFEYLDCNKYSHVDVLGINCGMGSNPLKVKESIRENVHNEDVTVYNITDEKCYISDLRGVSDEVRYINNQQEIETVFENSKFDYIIFESKLEIYKNPLQIISNLEKRIKDSGVICIKLNNILLKEKIKKRYSKSMEIGEWVVLKKV